MNLAVDSRPPVREVPPCDRAGLAGLERAFSGDLIGPGHPSYEEARKVWNGSIDRHPALIARCAGVADVVAAVTFARGTGLPLAGFFAHEGSWGVEAVGVHRSPDGQGGWVGSTSSS